MSKTERMMALFRGYMGAYGTHGATSEKTARGGQKLEIKKSAQTKRSPVTEELWAKHLDGTHPLGIIPIDEHHLCHWGVLDIDSYTGFDHAALVKKIDSNKLPLVVTRSKSGGAHVFLFMVEPIDAEAMKDKLHELAAFLQLGDIEVFPKQTTLDTERGLGSWLNMPYLGGDETERYGIKPNGLGMSVVEFLEHAEARRVTLEEFPKIGKGKRKTRGAGKAQKRNIEDMPVPQEDWSDGPPCLEQIVETGLKEGDPHSGRNKGLFNMAVTLKRKWPDDWEDRVTALNHEVNEPPLPEEEVRGVISQVRKKDYLYTCGDDPLCSRCNSALCRTRNYGIGDTGNYPQIEGLSFLESDPPMWFIDIAGKRIGINTAELMDYKAIQRVAMEKLHRSYKTMKNDTWNDAISVAMADLVIIEAPKEVSREGHFQELLEDFCVNRFRGKRIEDILTGRPWEDQDNRKHYFRIRDLMDFLAKAGLRDVNRGEVMTFIKGLKGDMETLNIKDRPTSVWWVPSTTMTSIPPSLDAPELKQEAI